MAYGAHDVLNGARVAKDLPEVLSETRFVVGFTGHSFRGYEPPVPLPQAVPKILAQARTQRVALLFGAEDSGLAKEEIVFCHRLVTIPTPGPHASLNLAQAVLVVLYELTREVPSAPSPTLKSATTADLEHLYEAWEALLTRTQMIRGRQGKSLLIRLRRILSRTSLTREEVRMLQGILQQVNWYLDHPGKKSEK
jgi:tRNA/rRNA methyltransferase